MIRDLKLRHLQTFQVVRRANPAGPDLSDVAQSYGQSVTNISTLSILLPVAVSSANLISRVEAKALLSVTGDIEQLPEGHPQQAAVDAAHSAALKNIMAANPQPGPSVLDPGFEHLDILLCQPMFAMGADAFLSTLALLGWTTFETLAGDLWEAALNAHPHGLSELKGVRSRIGKMSAWQLPGQGLEQTAQNASGGRSITLAILQKHGFDLHKKMGSLLKESNSFVRLDGIRTAHSLAFHEDSSEIDECLSSDALDSLSLVRNLIAHRGGKMDKQYLNGARNIQACPQGALGEMLALDGEMVAGLVIPVLVGHLLRDLAF